MNPRTKMIGEGYRSEVPWTFAQQRSVPGGKCVIDHDDTERTRPYLPDELKKRSYVPEGRNP